MSNPELQSEISTGVLKASETGDPVSSQASGVNAVDPAIDLVADTIGQMMEYWGFKHIMGRLWSVLFLSPRPLSAPEIAERLRASSGSISMALNDLLQWGRFTEFALQNREKDHFVAESNIWKLLSRVLTERENKRIETALDQLERAGVDLSDRQKDADAGKKDEMDFQIRRIEELQKLGELAREVLLLVVLKSRVDVTPLRKFFEVRKKESKE